MILKRGQEVVSISVFDCLFVIRNMLQCCFLKIKKTKSIKCSLKSIAIGLINLILFFSVYSYDKTNIGDQRMSAIKNHIHLFKTSVDSNSIPRRISMFKNNQER